MDKPIDGWSADCKKLRSFKIGLWHFRNSEEELDPIIWGYLINLVVMISAFCEEDPGMIPRFEI
jgi:hypothetical protein